MSIDILRLTLLYRSSILCGMDQLDRKRRAAIVAALVEGSSILATCRMTGAAKGTVLELLVELGRACEDYHRRTLVNLRSKRIQCDEVWSFCYAKQKNVPENMSPRPS